MLQHLLDSLKLIPFVAMLFPEGQIGSGWSGRMDKTTLPIMRWCTEETEKDKLALITLFKAVKGSRGAGIMSVHFGIDLRFLINYSAS